MYGEITRKELISPLKSVVGVIENKPTVTILGNVALDLKDRNLSLTATDMEVEIKRQLTLSEPNLDNGGDGSITVSGKKLFEVCYSLPENAQIKFELQDDGKLQIDSGNSKFGLQTLPSEDYPESPTLENAKVFTIEASVLKNQIAKTDFSMANQDARHYLNGELFNFNGKKFIIVATDGHRLGLYEDELIESELNNDGDILKYIVPRKAILELKKLLSQSKGNVEISVDVNHIVFKVGDVTLSSKLIDGKYPNYKPILPEGNSDNPNIVIAKTALLKQSITRALILTKEKFKGVTLKLTKDILTVSSRNEFSEESKEELEVDYRGAALEIGFNGQYLLDILHVIDTDSVEIHFTDEQSSCLIRPRDDDQSTYVVMPMRL